MDSDLLYQPYSGSLQVTRLREGVQICSQPDHGTTDWMLLYTLAGTGGLHCGSRLQQLERGSLVCCAPGTAPAFDTNSSTDHWDLVLVRFRGRLEWNHRLQWPQLSPGVGFLQISSPSDITEIETALALIVEYQGALDPLRDALAVNMLERVLLLSQKHLPVQSHYRLDPRIAKAIKEIQSHLKTALDIGKLANLANVSRSRFSHLFRDQTGISPQQYIERERMRLAMHLLSNTHRQIQDIASEAGFENAFYFSTRFKRHCGLSPRQWRSAAFRQNL